MNLAIAAIVKNEADGLLEWIAFHRLVGVSHFLIADNDSDDGTRELLLSLSRIGIVTLFDFPNRGEEKPQQSAYTKILQNCPANIDILAFIDADEFILPMNGELSLLPFVNSVFSDPSVGAVALNWAIFGSSGILFHENGLVIERFIKRATQNFSSNHHYKSLVRPQLVSYFPNPHHALLSSGRYIDVLGNDLVLNAKHGAGLSAEVLWNNARVNHYAVKSLEEFVVGKSRKGSASKSGRVKHKKYFNGHDKNDERCLLAQGFANKVHAEMDRLELLIKSTRHPASESFVYRYMERASLWYCTKFKRPILYPTPRYAFKKFNSTARRRHIFKWHLDFPTVDQLFEDGCDIELAGWMLPLGNGDRSYRCYVRSGLAMEYFPFNRQRVDVVQKFGNQLAVAPGVDGMYGFSHAISPLLAAAGFEFGFEFEGERIPVLRVNVRNPSLLSLLISRSSLTSRARWSRLIGRVYRWCNSVVPNLRQKK